MNDFKEKLEKMTTDELFDLLPAYIMDNNEIYFNLIRKSERSVNIEFLNRKKTKILFNTYRRGDTLKEVLIEYLELLNRNDLLKKPDNYFVEMIQISKILNKEDESVGLG